MQCIGRGRSLRAETSSLPKDAQLCSTFIYVITDAAVPQVRGLPTTTAGSIINHSSSLVPQRSYQQREQGHDDGGV